MNYTREIFARELDGFLSNDAVIDHKKIATWAYETRLRNLGEIDPKVSEWLMQLGAMDMGNEFEFSGDEIVSMIAAAREQ
jgi:hypothetical protein